MKPSYKMTGTTDSEKFEFCMKTSYTNRKNALASFPKMCYNVCISTR